MFSFRPLAALLATTALIMGGCGGVANAEPGVTGTNEDWLDAVCQPGTFNDGSWMPAALGGASCQSRGSNVAVLFTQWDSNFKMNNSMLQLLQCYSSVIHDNGDIEAFSFMRNSAPSNPLAGLRQFGFTLTPQCQP